MISFLLVDQYDLLVALDIFWIHGITLVAGIEALMESGHVLMLCDLGRCIFLIASLMPYRANKVQFSLCTVFGLVAKMRSIWAATNL